MVIEEDFPHAVSGIFSGRRTAQRRAEALVDQAGLETEQVRLVRPGDDELARKVEPDSQGIFQTMLSAHLWAALAGLTIGIVLAWAMISVGPNWARSNPWFTVLAFAWVGTLATALLGGLITLRPDRDRVALSTREASDQGDWIVVAHCRDQGEKDAALRQLERGSESTEQSL